MFKTNFHKVPIFIPWMERTFLVEHLLLHGLISSTQLEMKWKVGYTRGSGRNVFPHGWCPFFTRLWCKSTKRNNSKNNKTANFKCPVIKCNVKSTTRKEVSLHFKKTCRKLKKCKKCVKSYSTLYGLQQHKYFHKTENLNLKYPKCDKTFPF